MPIRALFVMIVWTVFLIACQTTEETVTTPNPEEIDEPVLSVEQIIKQAQQSLASIDSFSFIVSTMQTSSQQEEEISLSKLIMTKDPLAMHQKVKVTTPPLDVAETEFYFVDDTLYFKDGNEDRWYTYPDEYVNELIHMDSVESRISKQLDVLLQYKDDVIIAENEDSYVMTISGNSSELLGLIQDVSATINNKMNEEIVELLSTATVVDFSYDMCIDKETFLQKEMTMTITLQLTVDKEKVTIENRTTATIEDVNEITDITVPQAILEQAQPFSLDRSEVEDMMQEETS